MSKLTSWAKRHKVIAAVVALSAVAVIGSAIAGPGAPAPTAKVTDAAKSVPKAQDSAPALAVDADTAAARGWIHKSAHYTNEVQVAVQSVQASLALIQNSGGGTADAAALSTNLGQAHDFLDEASVFLVGVIDGHMKTQRQEAWYAADELKDAVGKARSYLDDQKPSELADFQTKFNEGVQYWNEAVTALYAKAGIPKPPTI